MVLPWRKMCSHASLNLSQKRFKPILIYVKATNLSLYFAMNSKDISRDSPKHMLMRHHSVTNPLKDKLLKKHSEIKVTFRGGEILSE